MYLTEYRVPDCIRIVSPLRYLFRKVRYWEAPYSVHGQWMIISYTYCDDAFWTCWHQNLKTAITLQATKCMTWLIHVSSWSRDDLHQKLIMTHNDFSGILLTIRWPYPRTKGEDLQEYKKGATRRGTTASTTKKTHYKQMPAITRQTARSRSHPGPSVQE